MRLYLDLCAIQRPLDDQSQVRVRAESEAVLGLLALCPGGTVTLLASGAHDVEIGRCPLPDRRDHVERVLRLATVYLPLTPDIERQARHVHAEHGIGHLDAFHLAAAVAGRADFFCTTDDRLHRRARRADTGSTYVVSPLELVARLPSR